MKKLILILGVFLAFGISSYSQTKTFVQVGIATSDSTIYESMEVGATTGKNRLSILVESYNLGNDLTFNSDREFYGGIRYTRGITVGKKLDFLMTGAAKAHIDKEIDLMIEPGVGLSLNLNKNFSIVGVMSSPIAENTNPFSPMQLKGGVAIQVKL